MALKCPRCGGMMVRAIQEKNSVLYECCECDNYMIEYFYTDPEFDAKEAGDVLV